MSSINRSMANETINEWDDEDVFQSGVRESTRLFGGVAAGTGQNHHRYHVTRLEVLLFVCSTRNTFYFYVDYGIRVDFKVIF